MADFYNDLRFPTQIALGSTGGPEYALRRVNALGGKRQKIPLYDEAVVVWTFTKVVWKEEVFNEFLNFWHVVGGPEIGFRFRDPSDYFLGMEWSNNALVYSGDPHEFAEGDGVETDFQLARVYSVGARERRRKITRPIEATIKVYEWVTDEWVEITSGFTVDDETGIVAFEVAPSNGQRLAFAGQYDWPAEFELESPGIVVDGFMRGRVEGLRVRGIIE